MSENVHLNLFIGSLQSFERPPGNDPEMKFLLSAFLFLFFSVSAQAQLFGFDGGFGVPFGEQPRYEARRPRIIIRSVRKPPVPTKSYTSKLQTGSGDAVFCVRTCDGFYFRLQPGKLTDGTESRAKICKAMCPGSPITLFSPRNGTDIENAVDAKGRSYAKLPNALRYRKEVVSACSCQTHPGDGLAELPITQDPTLKKGDMVVSKGGVRTFKGSDNFPYVDADFAKPQDLEKVR